MKTETKKVIYLVSGIEGQYSFEFQLKHQEKLRVISDRIADRHRKTKYKGAV